MKHIYEVCYLSHFFSSKEVVIGEVDGVWSCHDGQRFGQMMAVREIHVEDVTNLWMLKEEENHTTLLENMKRCLKSTWTLKQHFRFLKVTASNIKILKQVTFRRESSRNSKHLIHDVCFPYMTHQQEQPRPANKSGFMQMCEWRNTRSTAVCVRRDKEHYFIYLEILIYQI